jgi:hypothetical protein
MKRSLYIIVAAALFTSAFALGTFSPVFAKKYSVKKDSNLGKAGCLVCHASAKGGKLNPYGKDLKEALGDSKKLTSEVLAKIESKDSNGNGIKNIDEIKADKLPGAK